jgi:hypothetical protein
MPIYLVVGATFSRSQARRFFEIGADSWPSRRENAGEKKSRSCSPSGPAQQKMREVGVTIRIIWYYFRRAVRSGGASKAFHQRHLYKIRSLSSNPISSETGGCPSLPIKAMDREPLMSLSYQSMSLTAGLSLNM